MKKVLYVVLDGLGDLPCPELDGQTPLEAAATPCMDSLAKAGKTGLMYTVGKGIAPESDIAVISILGYDAEKYYTGRGPLESYAVGLEVNDGDLALRVNFATLGEEGKIIDRRVGRNLTTEEATKLTKSINKKVKLSDADFVFKNTIGHRGVLVIKDNRGKLSGRITNTDPAYDQKGVFGVAREKFDNILLKSEPQKEFANSPQAQRAAQLLNEFTDKSHRVLETDPVNNKRKNEGKMIANVIVSRDAGDKLPSFPQMGDKYKMKFGSLVEMPVERGIALLTGMEIIKLPLPMGDATVDYPERVEKLLKSMKKYDLLYVHLKGPDEPAHDGKALKKKESIELIDKFFFEKLLGKIDLKQTVIAVTADHSTPCPIKAHSDDPVPLLISGGDISADGVEHFSEKACSKGSIGIINGPDFLPQIIKLAGGK